MFIKRDPGPCPVDDAPHTTCCAPGGSSDVIIAGRIEPTLAITVPLLTTGPLTPPGNSATGHTVSPPPAPSRASFTTTTYRGRRKPTNPSHAGG